MASTRLVRTSLSTQVADRLLGEILDGTFPPGSSLPSEVELTDRFGVSRVVVREAVRVLETQGVVESSQGKRPVVSGLNANMPKAFFGMLVRTDERAIFDLIEVRQVLEVANARQAAERATGAHIRALQESIESMRANRGNPDEYDAADVAFHEVIAAASGNRLSRLLIEALGEMLRASREASRRGHLLLGLEASGSIEAHERILKAIERRDPDASAHAMSEHLKGARADLEAAFAEDQHG